jgi:hypothetical protein
MIRATGFRLGKRKKLNKKVSKGICNSYMLQVAMYTGLYVIVLQLVSSSGYAPFVWLAVGL